MHEEFAKINFLVLRSTNLVMRVLCHDNSRIREPFIEICTLRCTQRDWSTNLQKSISSKHTSTHTLYLHQNCISSSLWWNNEWMVRTMDIISITMKVALSGTYKLYTYTQSWCIRIYTYEGSNLEIKMQQFGTQYVSMKTQVFPYTMIDVF